jgi:hypothetical protein
MLFVRHMTAHGEFERYLNAATAVRRPSASPKNCTPASRPSRTWPTRIDKSIWDAHVGNFSQVGVGVSKVEKSYPPAKMIARITAPGAPYEVKCDRG